MSTAASRNSLTKRYVTGDAWLLRYLSRCGNYYYRSLNHSKITRLFTTTTPTDGSSVPAMRARAPGAAAAPSPRGSAAGRARNLRRAGKGRARRPWCRRSRRARCNPTVPTRMWGRPPEGPRSTTPVLDLRGPVVRPKFHPICDWCLGFCHRGSNFPRVLVSVPAAQDPLKDPLHLRSRNTLPKISDNLY